MRFLILTQYFPPEIGAPQIRLAALARVLRHRGHEVEIVTALPHHLSGSILPEYRRTFYRRDAFEGCPVHRTWVYAATGAGPRRLLNYISFTLTSLVGLAFAKRPDFIFVESPPLFLGTSGAIFGLLRRVPMIFNVSDLWPDSVRELGVVRNRSVLAAAEWLERRIYSRSRFVNAVTSGIRKALIERKKVPAAKVLDLPNGVDTELFAPREPDGALVRQLHLDHGVKILLYAGTHGVAQGLETLIDAAALLKDKNVAFLFIGDGPTKAKIVSYADALSLHNVKFLGIMPVEDIPKYFSIATASIVPLVRNELFKGARPSKIYSSLAAGVPVIFCGEGEAADLLTSSDSGIAVAPESPTDLAAAIMRLCEDEQLRARLGRNGRILADQHFDWDAIVERWLSDLRSRSQTSLKS